MFNPNSSELLANEVKHDFAFEDNAENLNMHLALAETTAGPAASETPATTPPAPCNCPPVVVPPPPVERIPPPPNDIWYLLLCVFGTFIFSLGVGGLSLLCDKKEEKKEEG